jgi:hypothetical protein
MSATSTATSGSGASTRRRRARPPLRPRQRRTPNARATSRRQTKQSVRPEVQWILDAITGVAAFVSNERLDILAANQLRLALYFELYDGPVRPVNTARFVFLDPRAETSYGGWDRVATETVGILRSAAGRDPHNRDLSDLVGELATQSEAFRTRWARTTSASTTAASSRSTIRSSASAQARGRAPRRMKWI